MDKKLNIIIQVSKTKLIVLLCRSILLLGTCLSILFEQPLLEDLFYNQPILEYAASSLGIILSVLAMYFFVPRNYLIKGLKLLLAKMDSQIIQEGSQQLAKLDGLTLNQ